MKRFAAAILTLCLCTAAARADEKHPRPKILGIASAHFYSTNLSAARAFYSIVFARDLKCTMCEEHAFDPITVALPSGQIVIFTGPSKGPVPSNFLAEVVFATDNTKAMEAYLKANCADDADQCYSLITLRYGILRCQALLTWCEETIDKLRLFAEKNAAVKQ